MCTYFIHYTKSQPLVCVAGQKERERRFGGGDAEGEGEGKVWPGRHCLAVFSISIWRLYIATRTDSSLRAMARASLTSEIAFSHDFGKRSGHWVVVYDIHVIKQNSKINLVCPKCIMP
jgi:hypothetical protein